jgi:outer membrane protein TolC
MRRVSFVASDAPEEPGGASERVNTEQAEAERQRLSAGASIAIVVQQAEDSLRQAKLRLERARVDWTQAEIDLAHLSGRLLARYREALERVQQAG